MKTCTKCKSLKELSEFGPRAKAIDGLNPRCRACIAHSAAAWRAANPGKEKANHAKWYSANREKAVAVSAAYRAENPEKCAATNATYRAANSEKCAARGAAYREAHRSEKAKYNATYYLANRDAISSTGAIYRTVNREKIKAAHAAYYAVNRKKVTVTRAAWSKANPDVLRASGSLRRARKRESDGAHTAADIKLLRVLQKYKCAVCKVDISAGYHADHIQPLSKGGSNDKHNIQLLCPACNLKKGASDPLEFMQSRGYLI